MVFLLLDFFRVDYFILNQFFDYIFPQFRKPFIIEANDSDRYLIGDWSGHNSKINCFARLLNGNIISGSNDKTIRIRNQYNGSLIKIFSDQPSSVMSIAVLLNGDIVSGYFESSIQILNPNDGKILRKLLGHAQCVQTSGVARGGASGAIAPLL
ncbi:unnamed protein product [Brachionus calyciflorus]|uniref:Uncharacterized protein n=1 Tax=Brachionus calyciflorus TaxID=104777 RepID=A0A813V336_9BILA|nr:unnamed protein product [Brachionus calyciflorus]